jgi:hypothetical protein
MRVQACAGGCGCSGYQLLQSAGVGVGGACGTYNTAAMVRDAVQQCSLGHELTVFQALGQGGHLGWGEA